MATVIFADTSSGAVYKSDSALCRRSAAISPIKVASPTLDAGGEVGPPASKEASIVGAAVQGGALVSPGGAHGGLLVPPPKAITPRTRVKTPATATLLRLFMLSP